MISKNELAICFTYDRSSTSPAPKPWVDGDDGGITADCKSVT